MKKIFDRRMIGFIMCVASVHALAAKVTEPATVAIIVPAAFSTLVICLGILVGGNVTQAVGEKLAGKKEEEVQS